MARKTQKQRMLKFFKKREGKRTPVRKLLIWLRIMQYNRIIYLLRKDGYKIENKTERKGREKYSRFRYTK